MTRTKLTGAAAIAAKCGGEMAEMYRPYGGATSFAEVETYQKGQDVLAESNVFAMVIQNIISDTELDTAAKASLIKQAASEAEKRFTSAGTKSFLGKLTGGFIRPRAAKATDYKALIGALDDIEDDDEYETEAKALITAIEADKSLNDAAKESLIEQITADDEPATKAVGTFRITKDAQTGAPRWVLVGSNQFEDREREIVSLAAISEYVEYADKSQAALPELRVWHIEDSRIGQSDMVAEHEGFLIATGLFDDPAYADNLERLGKSADLAVSMGFEYLPGDRADGVFEWIRPIEFSVLPRESAANQLTVFATGQKEAALDTRKKAFLSSVTGEEFADVLTKSVATMGRRARDAGIAYKDTGSVEPDDDDEETEIDEEAESIDVEIDGKEYRAFALKAAVPKPAVTKKKPAFPGAAKPFTKAKSVDGPSLADIIGQALAPIGDTLAAMNAKLDTHETAIKALASDDDDKVADLLRPRTIHDIRRKSVQDDDEDDDALVAAATKAKSKADALPEHLAVYGDMGLGSLLQGVR